MPLLNSYLHEVVLLRTAPKVDSRGMFCEAYSRREYVSMGIANEFVQDNHSISRRKGVVRGLHFQVPPFAQAKLLRVLRGSILDVAVDIRVGSPTYGKHIAMVLSASDWTQVFIPAGFAHGFCALEPETEILYKVDNYYSPEHDRGIRWNDPALGIAWPVSETEAQLSEKDLKLPFFDTLSAYFAYDGAACGEPVPVESAAA